MRYLMLSFLGVSLLAGLAGGAAVDTWPWNKGYLKWSWDGPADPSVTGFFLECGPTAGTYTISKTYAASVFQVDLKTVLPTPGAWVCRVTPTVGTTLGYPSATYPFACNVGVVLTGGTN